MNGGNHLSSIEGKGARKTLTVLHKMLRYLLIYYRISFMQSFHLRSTLIILELSILTFFHYVQYSTFSYSLERVDFHPFFCEIHTRRTHILLFGGERFLEI